MTNDDPTNEIARLVAINSRLNGHIQRLNRLADAIRSGLDLHGFLRVVRDIYVEDCGMDRSGVFFYDPVTETMNGSWGTDIHGAPEDLSSSHEPFSDWELEEAKTLYSQGRGFLLRHYEPNDPRTDLPPEMSGVHDHLVLFLFSSDRLLGFVALDNLLTNRAITEEDAVDLLPFSHQVAIALHNVICQAEQISGSRLQRQIMDITLAIMSKDDPKIVYLMVRNTILETGLVDRTSVWTVDDCRAYGTWGSDENGDLLDEHNLSFPVHPDEFLGSNAQFVIDTIYVTKQDGTRVDDVSHAYIPLRVENELVGIVIVDTLLSKRRITPRMISVLGPIADQAAVAIKHSKLLAEREAVVRQQKRIMDISVAITANEDPDAVIRMVRDGILESGAVDRVGVWLVEGDKFQGTWGTDEFGNPTDEHNETMPLFAFEHGFSACLYGDEEYSVDDHQTIVSLDGEVSSNVPFGIIPLKTEGTLVGILTIDNLLSRRSLRSERLDVILPLAKQAAVVVKNNILRAEAEQEIARRRSAEEQLLAHTEELTLARDAALAGTKAKSEFLANMSHEIRTPMNGVIGMISMLVQTPLSPEQKHYARVVQESAAALLSVVEDILDISTLEAGMLKIAHRPFNIRTCIEDVAELIASQMVSGHVELNCVIPVRFPEWLIGDGDRIRQMVTNLLGNALKFTPKGEVTVQMSCVCETDQQARIRIEVVDTGIGIPTNRQTAIFESFTQVDGSSTRRHGGAGLGLTITKQIAELMGGSVGLSSEPNEGSTFWLDVTLDKQATISSETTRNIRLENASILVVIENPRSRQLLCEYILSWGCRLVIAENAQQALQIAMNHGEDDPFDIIICCCDEPLQDGAELLNLLRGIPATAISPAILLTTVFNRHQVDASRYADFAAVMIKPIRPSNLRNTLERLRQGTHVSDMEIAPPLEEEVGLGLRILLAEDNMVNSMVACTRLEFWGCQCVPIEDGNAVVQAATREHFDMILMDVSMPVMDGIQATQEIRLHESQTGTHVPIIAMTAYALEGDREKCLAAGMDDYIAKPINFEELFKKLQRWGKRLPKATDR